MNNISARCCGCCMDLLLTLYKYSCLLGSMHGCVQCVHLWTRMPQTCPRHVRIFAGNCCPRLQAVLNLCWGSVAIMHHGSLYIYYTLVLDQIIEDILISCVHELISGCLGNSENLPINGSLLSRQHVVQSYSSTGYWFTRFCCILYYLSLLQSMSCSTMNTSTMTDASMEIVKVTLTMGELKVCGYCGLPYLHVSI